MKTQLKGKASIEELLKFRNDVTITLQIKEIDSLFRVTFEKGKVWCPSCTIMEELGITFTGCGVRDGGMFVLLSTHKQDNKL